MVDMENMGSLGRFFGAMVSKLGMPIPTQISQHVLHKAIDISQSGDNQQQTTINNQQSTRSDDDDGYR